MIREYSPWLGKLLDAGKDAGMLFLGLDVGTQGARVVVVDAQGQVQASHEEPLLPSSTPLPPGWSEQDPADWWRAATLSLRAVTQQVRPTEIRALAVTSTSGTLVPVGFNRQPLRPAIMYNDSRAVAEAQRLHRVGARLERKLGYQFQPSFSLAKILWLQRHEPHLYRQTDKFLHAADWLVGKLTGHFTHSDYSNALKTGYDLVDLEWPGWFESQLGLPAIRLPQVVPPGQPIATVSLVAAAETGLAAGTPVISGATDGTAAFLASGADGYGAWNSTLGTTLVVRGISPHLVRDPQGRIYCHRHPDGPWLPGGASNVGGECLATLFAQEEWSLLDQKALALSPTQALVYPLARQGERLPFVDPQASAFAVGSIRSREEQYTACLEGVAFVERWIFELIESLGAPLKPPLWATGGGARSQPWLQLRANVLQQPLIRPKYPEAAFGAAILAAAGAHFGRVKEAVRAMVQPYWQIEPDPTKSDLYTERYQAFREECRKRGYK